MPRAVGANAPGGRRAAVAAALACSIQPFQFGDLFRVECEGLSFETTSDAVRAEAHARLQRDVLRKVNVNVLRDESSRHAFYRSLRAMPLEEAKKQRAAFLA